MKDDPRTITSGNGESTRGASKSQHPLSNSPEVTLKLLDQFEEQCLILQEQVKSYGQRVTRNVRRNLKASLIELLFQFESTCQDNSLDETTRLTFLEKFKQEMLPYLLLSENASRWFEKPRGYAGDYLTMKRLYYNETGGKNVLGEIIDTTLMDLPPVHAVRNRRRFLRDVIIKVIDSKKGATSITSLACGSAEEVFDVLEVLPDDAPVTFNLIDVDPEATSHLHERALEKNVEDRLEIYRCNVIHLMRDRDQLDLESQDLIYSAGLIDYFDDEHALKILNRIHSMLASGGRLILGNFSPSNPNRALMDHVFDWTLVHRSKNDLRDLVGGSPLNESTTVLRKEPREINHFVDAKKSRNVLTSG